MSRRHWHHEDKRWALWRERWAAGLGWLGVKSVEVNFLFFYQAQALATALIFSAPLHLVCVVSPTTDANTQPALHALEIAACALWAVAFALENVADHQLSVFHAEQTASGPLNGGVLRTGLWRFSCVRCVFFRDWNCIMTLIRIDSKFMSSFVAIMCVCSRHPNYFFEFLIWVAYALFALPSARGASDFALLALVPAVAYYFLVHFTGTIVCRNVTLSVRAYCSQFIHSLKRPDFAYLFFPCFFSLLHRSVDVRAIVTEAARCRVQAVYRVYVRIFPVVSAPKSHMMAATDDDSRRRIFICKVQTDFNSTTRSCHCRVFSPVAHCSRPPCRDMFSQRSFIVSIRFVCNHF